MAYLGTNSQCCYCRCPVDMKKVMDYEKIERSLPKPLTPVKMPKHDLQQMLMEEKTPLQDADQVHSESNEKKCMAQLTQANRIQNDLSAREGYCQSRWESRCCGGCTGGLPGG